MAKLNRKLKQAPREGAGRPKVLPAEARTRSIRLTDAEYAAVLEYVRRIREKPPEKIAIQNLDFVLQNLWAGVLLGCRDARGTAPETGPRNPKGE